MPTCIIYIALQDTRHSRCELRNVHRALNMAVAVGIGFTVALTEDGSVCTFGRNNMGQLGVGHTRSLCQPTILDRLRNFGGQDVVMVAACFHNSACVSGDGAVWTWGSNAYGQLGRGSDVVDTHTPGRIDPLLFGNSPAHMVACGENFTLILNSRGEVWACGLNEYGQLGLGHTHMVNAPTRIDPVHFGDMPVAMIACGSRYSMAVAHGGRELFGWGWNDAGQLGVGVGISQSTDLFDPIRSARYWVPRRSTTAAALGKAAIVFISAGHDFTMLVTDAGDLWGCGNGRGNEFGLGDGAVHLQFQWVGGESLFGRGGVRMVSCGFHHSLIVGKNGSLWSCGRGSLGGLGTGFRALDGADQQNNERPTLLDRTLLCNSNVVVVAAGRHSVAVTAHGRVCTWGKGMGRGVSFDRTPDTDWTPIGLSVSRMHAARVGRWHDVRVEMREAFAMGAHEKFAAVGGRTAYSDNMPEDVLVMLCDYMRFAPRKGASQALRHLLGLL